RVKAGFEKGKSIWLYIPKAFRIEEIWDDFRLRRKVKATDYSVNPWVHISRLKPRVVLTKRTTIEVDVENDDGFEAALLPEDSWQPGRSNDVAEMELIQDVQWVKRTSIAIRSREYLI
ncbi:hypothetical protein PHMEG_00031752, partial [Phytophthora megakarya]